MAVQLGINCTAIPYIIATLFLSRGKPIFHNLLIDKHL